MNDKKKNVPMIVALSIPVLMVLLVSISIYLPTLFIKPQFDFIYSTGQHYCCGYTYTVKDGKVVMKNLKNKDENNTCCNHHEPRLFYYDVQTATAKEIQFEETRKYALDSRYKSQDGFEIVSGNRSFDIFFMGGSSYYDKYIKKGAFSRRIETGRTYYYDFNFLGWVKE